MLFFFSTKFPEEETGQDSVIVPVLPPSHESQRKKLQEELTVTLLVCAVDPYSLGSQFKSFHYPPLQKQVQKGPLGPNRPRMPMASCMSWALFCTRDSFHGQYRRGNK